jgi:hypothetical protein
MGAAELNVVNLLVRLKAKVYTKQSVRLSQISVVDVSHSTRPRTWPSHAIPCPAISAIH